jgi:two-component system response regulator TctD
VPARLKTPCRVLIVEDNQTARDALVQLLKQLGYHTDAAGTVAEGLAQLNGQQCAILDVNLPDGLGTAILKRIRTESRPIRVAVATGTTDDELMAEVRSHKPDLLLRKPFDVNALLDWLEAAG